MYCRICLSETNYKEIPYKILDHTWFEQIVDIYVEYVKIKKFDSVLPLFYEEICYSNTEVLGYFDKKNNLEAFSLIYKYDSQKSCLADQFAWTYKNSKAKLGYKSIRSECARYKRLGFDYLYLGESSSYKEELKGFQLI